MPLRTEENLEASGKDCFSLTLFKYELVLILDTIPVKIPTEFLKSKNSVK